jgi:hypothetical protein
MHTNTEAECLAFSPIVGIRTPPPPHPQARVFPPPLVQGGTHSLGGEGVGESQFLRGDRHCGLLTINCGVQESAEAGGEAQLELRGRGIPGAMLAPPSRHLHSRSVYFVGR